jgi:hypothetical protein
VHENEKAKQNTMPIAPVCYRTETVKSEREQKRKEAKPCPSMQTHKYHHPTITNPEIHALFFGSK